MQVEPVARTLQEVRDNITILQMMEAGGSFRAEIGWDKLSLIVEDYDAFFWTNKRNEQLQAHIKKPNRRRCQICGKKATVFFDECSCGSYAWCYNCEGVDPNGYLDENGRYIGRAHVIWDHYDHECSPECCSYGHPYPEVTLEEMDYILRINMPPREEICFLEDPRSKDGSPLFHVKVRRKSREERASEKDDIRKMFDVREDKIFRTEKEDAFVRLFFTR